MTGIPIIMTAFGTTADAIATYAALEEAIGRGFPGDEIIWTYSSRVVTRTLQAQDKPALHLQDALEALAGLGPGMAVVQSLHLFPGSEFHRLALIAGRSGLRCAIGSPLFTLPADYERLGPILEPIVGDKLDKAILILGHGTGHPTWTAYYSLERILRRRFGSRLYVGVVEKFPNSDHLPDEIAAAGFTEAIIVPLFLVGGMHVFRDIVGDGQTKSSWMTRLEEKNIAVTCFHHGLGLLPGLAELVVDHIAEAREKLLSGGPAE